MGLRFFSYLLVLVYWFSPGTVDAQDQAVLVVVPNARGSKGTLCELCDHSGKLVGAKIIVRGFFSQGGNKGKTVVTVTTSEETLNVRGETVPIFYLVDGSEPRPFAPGEFDSMLKQKPKLKKTTKPEYFLIDGDAAILIPANWGMNENVSPPMYLNGENTKLSIGLSVLKEDPEELEITSLKEYSRVKAELLQENFPDFAPTAVKQGQIGDLEAGFFQGPGTIEKVKGTIICMTIQGESHFYLLLGIAAETSPTDAVSELVKVMKSFKER